MLERYDLCTDTGARTRSARSAYVTAWRTVRHLEPAHTFVRGAQESNMAFPSHLKAGPSDSVSLELDHAQAETHHARVAEAVARVQAEAEHDRGAALAEARKAVQAQPNWHKNCR